jgi:hypothetical protein
MAPRLLLLLAGLGLAACSLGPKYTGAQGAGLTLHGDRVSARGAQVSVTASFEAGYLPALAGEYPVFRVAIRNVGAAPVTFTTAQFGLLDGKGRQHAAVLPGDIRDVHGRWYCRPRFGMGLGWGWRGGAFGTLGAESDSYECDPPVEEMFNESLLPAGPLLPGAKMVGYVFFRGALNGSDTLTLVVSPPGEPPLRLTFRKR